MDGPHFDALSRALVEARSRRGLTRLLGGLLLGGSPGSLAPGESAAKGKQGGGKKPKKKRGRPALGCAPSCAGAQCGDDGCGGSCGGCPVCQACAGGTCRPADDAPCGINGRCLHGACNATPLCRETNFTRCQRDVDCCSTKCYVGEGCAAFIGPDGGECLVNEDCASRRCVGYRCACSAGVRACPNGKCGLCCTDDDCFGVSTCAFSPRGQCVCPSGTTPCGAADRCIPTACDSKCAARCQTDADCGPRDTCSILTCQLASPDGSKICTPP